MPSPDPTYFSYNSEFAGIKNYAPYTLASSVSITGVIAPGAVATFNAVFLIDRSSTIIQPQVLSTAEPTKTYIIEPSAGSGGAGFYFNRLDGALRAYAIQFAYVYTSSTVTIQAFVQNPYGTNLTVNNETLTYSLRIFVAPFEV